MKYVFTFPHSPEQINHIGWEKNDEMDDREEKESNYFHGCRKDAYCACKMCLASITATLDLMSVSAQQSSLTKLSASKPYVDKTPVSIDPTLLSTPTSRVTSFVAREVDVKKNQKGCKFKFWRWVILLLLIIAADFGFCWGVLCMLQPRLSDAIVRGLVEELSNVRNLTERLNLDQKSWNYSVDGKCSSCILGDSNWKINQDGMILLPYCNLYKSAAEGVRIVGWPLQIAGIMTARSSPRLFNVMYGRISKRPEGKIMCVVREANMPWILPKFSTVVEFEQSTWIIEYRRSSLLEDQSILQIVMEFVKLRILKFIKKTKQRRWLLPNFRYYNASTLKTTGFKFPT